MAALMLEVIPSFSTNNSKNSLVNSANIYETYVVSR